MVTTDATPDRLNAFSDAVFAVIITVLVLDLSLRFNPRGER
jgi:uncharacterized membrane protein